MIRKLKFLKAFRFLSLIVVLASHTTAVAKDYIIQANGEVDAEISEAGVNHLKIENDRIAQVIGNEDEYIIESDPNLGQVYITPFQKEGSFIKIRLVTEREKTVDLKLEIKKVEQQTINLKYKNDSQLDYRLQERQSIANSAISNTRVNEFSIEQQTIENLKLAYSGKLQGKNILSLNCLKEKSHLMSLKLVEGTQYHLNGQTIIKAIISNKAKEILYLKESDFVDCMKQVEAVSVGKIELAPGFSTTVFMVGKDGK